MKVGRFTPSRPPFVVFLLLLALAGLLWTPWDPASQEFREQALAGPSLQHWLGVDGIGRDVFSRLWRGAGNTTAMGLVALAGTLALSVLLLVAERIGPHPLPRIIPLTIGIWVALPVVLIALVALVFLAPSPPTIVFAAALGNVPLAYRQLRILWREQVSAPYVEASEALGASRWHRFCFTLWPNLRPDLLALARLLFALAALELSGLAFLGLIGDPDFPELGAILRQNQKYLFQDPLLVIWPGLLLSGLLAAVHAHRE